ncbi:MAG: hypothetical protein RI568_13075 [Natronomonas sp.]|uniref:hypothetical protein n=1 Tax=Natronomonas sp. TaxID=2184060 RepID=UPI00286FDCD6|nr:hypothetical protein [Natronomonas sp.]MDR9431614.1 hypothetical protein [Natronomonas sp.]
MIWTGEPGQLATAWVLILVPGSIWQSAAMALGQRGVAPTLALGAATILTAGWLAVVLTSGVRGMVIRAIFPDERDESARVRDGVELRDILGGKRS